MKEAALYEKANRANGSYPYISTNTRNINFINHFHEELEIVYMLEGKTQISTDDGFRDVCRGDICFIMPGEVHGFISAAPNSMILMKIALVSEKEHINFALMRLKNCIVSPESPVHDELAALLREMVYENEHRESGYEFAVRAAVGRLIAIMMRRLEYEYISVGDKERIQSGLNLLKNVNDYIEENYTHDITLSDIAVHCKYSIYYFSHLFKDVTGISFGDYLAIFRLKKSAALMSSSDAKLTEIAFACGFNNIRSFNRMFRKHFNATPSEYRNSLGA